MSSSPISSPFAHLSANRRAVRAGQNRTHSDDGLTLVELLVAFACLMVLLTMVGTALSTYINAGTTVISSYSATDQLLPGSATIQRLIRSQVEPATTPATSSTTNACATAVNVPCPPFLNGSIGTFSTIFYANVGDTNGPAKIVMAEGTPTKTGKFYSSIFTVTQYRACAASNAATATCPANTGCPFTLNSTYTCTWSTSGTVLVDIPNVVNGAATVSPQVTINGALTSTPLPDAAKPIFTYSTLDPYNFTYIPGDGGTPTAAGILFTNPGTCLAPTLDIYSNPTANLCAPDNIQNVGVDLEVEVQGAPIHENYFVVYRLSSASYLYSPLVG